MDHGIDFDEGARAWRENKKQLKDGSFVYICTHICKNGKQCGNKIKWDIDSGICKYHLSRRV
jgi:hypothetical protein